jgi:methionyl-tRNA formyltransferase
MKKHSHIPYVFFGSATFSLYVLDELEKALMPPTIIVTTPDKPVGRGLVITPTDVKVWAQKRGISVLNPIKLDSDFVENIKKEKDALKISCFVVAAYGKIIPQNVLDIPPRGTLNVHPSLLPRYRGATPIQSAMLDDRKETGVTIMRVDARMDHGPIVAQKGITVDEWPVYEILEETLGRQGGRLLANILPDWLAGTIVEKEQDHHAATFTTKIVKENGLITIDMEAYTLDQTIVSSKDQYDIFRKIQAYHQWPTAYFFLGNKIRVKITKAEWCNNHLIIRKVIPEGKKETDFNLFMRDHRNI